ncbi:MAG: lactonase family protein [Saprospiraceae bacterium]
MLTFFVGSYTEWLLPDFGGTGHGIYSVQLDPRTGALSVLHQMATRNPSYLALSEHQSYLYAVTELDQKDQPQVKAFQIQEDDSLVFLNEQPIKGSYPCHLTTHGRNVLVACYMTGNVLQFPVKASGELLLGKNNFHHKGASINVQRQEAAHAHQVTLHPNGVDVYVCDLGMDQLKAYQLHGTEISPNPTKDVSLSQGGGPRHLVFGANGQLAYVMNELSGNVSVLKNQSGLFQEIKVYNTLPNDYKGPASGSAIRLHPNGRFLYAANRKAEAISIFRVIGKTLKTIAHQYTQGAELREFNITPDGHWLIACHQNSHDTVVYQIREDGRLIEKYRTQEIKSPVCIAFKSA